MYMSETFYVLQHNIFGCNEPKCGFVHTQSEINTKPFQQFLSEHTFYNTHPDVYPVDCKTWRLDDVLNLKEVYGWTPYWFFSENGFTFEGEIDLIELFHNIKWNEKIENGQVYKSREQVPTNWEHDLRKKREQIEKILDKFDYKNRELAIFRTARRFPGQWDSIEIFSIGEYNLNKAQIREKITKQHLKNKEEKEKQRKEIQKKHTIKPIEWSKVEKKLEELKKTTKPGQSFIFDHKTLKVYYMDSERDRKQLYDDFTKEKSEAS